MKISYSPTNLRFGYILAPHPLVSLVCCLILVASCGGRDNPVESFSEGDYEASFRIFSQRAATGDSEANNYLGMHYYLGVGVTRDFVRAAKFFEAAALAELPDAQRNLGVMYLRGLGVEQDYHQAYGWFFAAHGGGNASAGEYLNLMGDNVTPNASGIARKHVREQIAARAASASVPVSPSAN